MVVEETLIQYGAIGACLVYFMYDKIRTTTALLKTVENNTIAVTKVYEVMQHCENKKKVKGGK